MYIIPIDSITLDLIQALNGGVRPELEAEATFFVYKGETEPPEIVTRDYIKGKENQSGKEIKIFHLEK